MIITSNMEFAEWTQIFKDEQMAPALAVPISLQ
ncbi:ATP-binding protein [Brevibacillus gelatini]